MKIQYHHKGKSERVRPSWTESSHRGLSWAIADGVGPSLMESGHCRLSWTIVD